MSLGELLTRIDEISDGPIVYVPDGEDVGLATGVTLLSLSEVTPRRPEHLTYLLEVEIIKDVLQTWSDWRGGRTPTLDDKLRAVLHYADHDAYLPAE
jgi:hypothetical protein